MSRLLPEGNRPCKLAALHHSFVSTPCTVHQHIKLAGLDLLKCSRSLVVLGMVATDSDNIGGEIRRVDAAACREYFESSICQGDGDATSDTPACTGNECGLHA
jgi:hypothetical protein